MPFVYTESIYYDVPANVFAQGYADLLISGGAAIYAEVAAEQGKPLPALSANQIFVGKVNKEDPKLLTIEFDYNDTAQAQYNSRLLNLSFVIRSGSDVSPAEQLIRSSGYISVVSRLTHALTRYNGFAEYLLDSWPAQLPAEDPDDYAIRKSNYHKKILIELVSINGLPSNAAALAASGYEGGLRITLQVSSAAR